MALLTVTGFILWTTHITDAQLGVRYEPMPSGLRPFTSLTCSTWPCRSRLAASVLCTETTACRAVWSNRTEDGHFQCGVCDCLSNTSKRTDTTRLNPGLHVRVQNKFNIGPDVDLPMDTVVSTKLQGSLEGHMMNGARLVAGQNGKALCLDAAFQYVEFSPGEEHECLKNPDHCSLGITFSMWLMDLGNTDFINIFLGNDGCQPTGIGFCFGFVPSAFFATIRGGSSAYRYRIPRSEKDTWEHIVIQFHPNGTIKFYKNGCDTYSYSIKEGYNMISPHSPESRWENKLFTLSHADNGAYIKLDDFLIWYDMILPDRIWKVYVQGGLV